MVQPSCFIPNGYQCNQTEAGRATIVRSLFGIMRITIHYCRCTQERDEDGSSMVKVHLVIQTEAGRGNWPDPHFVLENLVITL